MSVEVFLFEFEPTVCLTNAEATLHLALFSTEGLFGEARVRLEVDYRVDESSRTIRIEGTGEVAASVAKVYTGLLTREFCGSAFRVRRIAAARPTNVTPVGVGG